MGLRCQLSTRSLREGSVRVKPFLHLLWLKSVACNHGQIQETTTRDRTARNPLRERHLSVALRSSSITPSDVWYPGGESDVDRDLVVQNFTIPAIMMGMSASQRRKPATSYSRNILEGRTRPQHLPQIRHVIELLLLRVSCRLSVPHVRQDCPPRCPGGDGR